MKSKASWIVAILVLSFLTCPTQARGGSGEGTGTRGGGGAARTGGGVSRSPMTGSKMTRPVTRPTTRLTTRPVTRPVTRPTTRPPTSAPLTQGPTTRPATRPSIQPSTRPSIQPATRPATRPSTRPAERSTSRPAASRPAAKPMPLPSRPETKPGRVNYPRPADGNNHLTRPGGGGTIRSNRPVNINRPNIHRHPSTKPAWDSRKWGTWGNWNLQRPGFGNHLNLGISNNFHYNHNWGYQPNYWGSRPWWNASRCHVWHHGHWNYGWNKRWYGHYHYYRPRPWPGYVIYDNHNDFAEGVAWGLAAWGLGNIIYNIGYQSYLNPYPAPPVQSSAGTTIINYREPITVSAGKLPPGDAAAQAGAEEKSTLALAASRAAFKQGDYLAAMKSADEAIAHVPGDPAIHEYRALILFALGKYSEAAGVLNPVLASGPGWDWTTMTALYGSQTTYTDQLRKLEDYARALPADAATRFLLGYHYLVCAHLDQAYEQFHQAARLQPADTIAAQLRDLCKSSIAPDTGTAGTPPVEAEKPAAPPPVPADKLVGTWVSDRGDQGTVTLNLAADGKFTWTFRKGDQQSALTGDFSIDERGLLVLASEDSQMVGEIRLPEDTKLNFILAGGPQGDPGLNFNKAP